MPVEDHPVHPTTVDKGRYGCHNRPPYKPWYWGKKVVQVHPFVGKMMTFIGVQQMVKIPFHTGRPDCVYGSNGGDRKCAGCSFLKSTNDGAKHHE